MTIFRSNSPASSSNQLWPSPHQCCPQPYRSKYSLQPPKIDPCQPQSPARAIHVRALVVPAILEINHSEGWQLHPSQIRTPDVTESSRLHQITSPNTPLTLSLPRSCFLLNHPEPAHVVGLSASDSAPRVPNAWLNSSHFSQRFVVHLAPLQPSSRSTISPAVVLP